MSKRSRLRYDRMDNCGRLNYLSGFTRVYRDARSASRAERELACLAFQFPAALGSLKPGESLAGSRVLPPIGFSPQEGGLGFYFDEVSCRKLGDSLGPENEKLHAKLDRLAAFWRGECTAAKVRAAYPRTVSELLPPWTDRYEEEPIVGSALYRMSGSQPDYDKLIRLGLPGLEAAIKAARESKPQSSMFYQGLLEVVGLLRTILLSYADEASALASSLGSSRPEAVATMTSLEERLRSLAERPPQSLAEGFQLLWLYSLVSGSINYGRLDEALGDLLEADLDSCRLDWEGAIGLCLDFWRRLEERGTIYDGRVITGGRGRRNERNADLFAGLALETSRRAKSVLPQLSLRFYEGQDPSLLDKAYAVIAEGNPYPMLYNDDANIPAVAAAFKVSEKEAEQYLPFGCGEYVLYHRSFGTPSGIINLEKALEVVLGEGRCMTTGRMILSGMPRLAEYRTFEALWSAYAGLSRRYVDALAEQEAIEYGVVAGEADFLVLSLLFDDCIGRGLPLFAGGVRYLGGTIEAYGLVNAADSLGSIRRFVYRDGSARLEELVEALRCDFAGRKELRDSLEALPKYGNDDDDADDMLVRAQEQVCRDAIAAGERQGLASYLAVVINNKTNTVLGRHTGAGADGRRAGESMANGNAAQSGKDKSGLTALLNSLLKVDSSIHGGAVQNLKFSKEAFVAGLPMTKHVLATYFHRGGCQAMMTVVGRGELEDAYVHPERWPSLLVRVGGFSARFVELERDVQREILERTLY
jgi:pyruvate-formate lyase